MKKLLFSAVTLLSGIAVQAQSGKVGVNTPSPETTLDVRASNHLGAVTATDGIVVPRVNSLATSGSIDGQLVYLIADNGSFKKGFHFWNGSAWNSFDTSNDAFVNNPTSQRVELGTKADGTARTTGNQLVIMDSGNIGVGTFSPITGLQLVSNNETANKSSITLSKYSDASGSTLQAYRWRGSAATPANLQSGDNILNIMTYGRFNGGTVAKTTNIASVYTGDGLNNKSKLLFETATGAIASTNMQLTDKAAVSIGGAEQPVHDAVLDLNAHNIDPQANPTNKGFLAPKVALTSATMDLNTDSDNDISTYPNTTGLMVYNTGTGGLTPAGYYHWDGAAWVALAGSGSGADTTNDAFVNNATDTRVELGTKSTGGARANNAEFVITDDASVGIGTTTPKTGLHLVSDLVDPGNKNVITMTQYSNTSGDALNFERYRGSIAAPENVKGEDTIITLNGKALINNVLTTSTQIQSKYKGNGTNNLSSIIFSNGTGGTNPSLSMILNEKAALSVGGDAIAQHDAVLDLNGHTRGITTTTKRGFLAPYVALTSTTMDLDTDGDANPATKANTAGLMIYNTGTGALSTKGYYYWNGTAWALLASVTPASASGASNAPAYSGSFVSKELTLGSTTPVDSEICLGDVCIRHNSTDAGGDLEIKHKTNPIYVNAYSTWGGTAGYGTYGRNQNLTTANTYGAIYEFGSSNTESSTTSVTVVNKTTGEITSYSVNAQAVVTSESGLAANKMFIRFYQN